MCKNKGFCSVVMLSEETKILELNQYRKSDETSSIIYADLKSLYKSINICKNNFEKPFTTKTDEHIPFRYSVSMAWEFDLMENKHDTYISMIHTYTRVKTG